MTETAAAFHVPGRAMREEFAGRLSFRSSVSKATSEGTLRPLMSNLPQSPNKTSGDSDNPELQTASVARLQEVVSELMTALRSALQEDRESAEVSLGRASALLTSGSTCIFPMSEEHSPNAANLQTPRGGLAPWQVRRVAMHIATQLENPITNPSLAAITKLSTYHFARAFRQSFGESPHQYVMRRRVERAQGLMLTTGTTIGRIAADCGLADQAHFNKLFRRMVGESPGAWRRARTMAST